MDDHPTAKCDVENGMAKEEEELLDLVVDDSGGTLTNNWYTEHASLYEQNKQFYHYQEECLKVFKEYVTQRDCSIIDFAMGTGIMGDLVSDGAGSGDGCNHDDDMRLTVTTI
ncbi:hypothetical protein HOLleu_39234 [Holothuria leucospilota]|uniref:Uncharacterized protein n=1 Tax=Holothuria leucospilota TaxID=206669 RepID=A0A9Q0YN36_HOLLE|nr:hypothetical protein HOLleu_39234 [Holothuria leucospilota]